MIQRKVVRIDHNSDARASTVVVDWNLGNKCNYRCSYCPTDLHSGSTGWPDLSVLEAVSNLLVCHYRDLGRCVYFQFSGGEPSYYEFFRELAQLLVATGSTVGVITNASRSPFWWKETASSLEYVCATYHVEFAEYGHFTEVIETLLEGGVSTHINVPMYPKHFEKCLQVGKDLSDRFPEVTLTLKSLLVDFGSDLYDYSPSQLEILRCGIRRKAVSTSTDRRARGPMKLIYSDGSTEIQSASQMLAHGQTRWSGWKCNAGIDLISINRNGRIHRSTCREGGLLGSIFDLNSITLPSAPVICGKDACTCLSDIMTSRWVY
jgi:organic radical activating enzyme